MFGKHSCVFSIHPALSEDPRRDSICYQQVVCIFGMLATVLSTLMSSSCGTPSKEELQSASWLFFSCSLGSCGLASVVSFSASLSGGGVRCRRPRRTFAACAAAGLFLGFIFVCLIILIIRGCVVWSLFFINSVIVDVPEAHKRDGAPLRRRL